MEKLFSKEMTIPAGVVTLVETGEKTPIMEEPIFECAVTPKDTEKELPLFKFSLAVLNTMQYGDDAFEMFDDEDEIYGEAVWQLNCNEDVDRPTLPNGIIALCNGFSSVNTPDYEFEEDPVVPDGNMEYIKNEDLLNAVAEMAVSYVQQKYPLVAKNKIYFSFFGVADAPRVGEPNKLAEFEHDLMAKFQAGDFGVFRCYESNVADEGFYFAVYAQNDPYLEAWKSAVVEHPESVYYDDDDPYGIFEDDADNDIDDDAGTHLVSMFSRHLTPEQESRECEEIFEPLFTTLGVFAPFAMFAADMRDVAPKKNRKQLEELCEECADLAGDAAFNVIRYFALTIKAMQGENGETVECSEEMFNAFSEEAKKLFADHDEKKKAVIKTLESMGYPIESVCAYTDNMLNSNEYTILDPVNDAGEYVALAHITEHLCELMNAALSGKINMTRVERLRAEYLLAESRYCQERLLIAACMGLSCVCNEALMDAIEDDLDRILREIASDAENGEDLIGEITDFLDDYSI